MRWSSGPKAVSSQNERARICCFYSLSFLLHWLQCWFSLISPHSPLGIQLLISESSMLTLCWCPPPFALQESDSGMVLTSDEIKSPKRLEIRSWPYGIMALAWVLLMHFFWSQCSIQKNASKIYSFVSGFKRKICTLHKQARRRSNSGFQYCNRKVMVNVF